MNIAGILFGGIAGFLEVNQKANALKKGFSYNYLLEIKSELERRRVYFSGYQDYNSFIEYEMNNFIHD